MSNELGATKICARWPRMLQPEGQKTRGDTLAKGAGRRTTPDQGVRCDRRNQYFSVPKVQKNVRLFFDKTNREPDEGVACAKTRSPETQVLSITSQYTRELHTRTPEKRKNFWALL